MTNHARALGHFLFLALLSTPLAAQTATVRVKDNLRTEPNGDVVAVVEPGMTLTVSGERDRWLEVQLEGWIWMRSLQVAAPSSKSGNYDLIVSAPEGENLRTKPSGAIVGHVDKGTMFDEQERVPGWVRARRKGWIWGASVDVKAPPATTASAAAKAPPSGATKTPPAATKAAPVVTTAPAGATKAAPAAATKAAPPAATKVAPAAPTPQPGATTRAATPPPAAPAGSARAPAGAGAAILSGPNGDTLARMRPGAQMQVVARQGSWVRVRVDGWTWLPSLDSAGGASPMKVDAAALAADPESYRGRVVSWDLQYLSLERAEKIRTDFFEGEPFLLTRHAGGGYVYVAIPSERLGEVKALLPLERITVVARVRAPVSTLTGSPILDLIELSRTPDR